MKKITAALALFLAAQLIGCSHVVVINSDPPGARAILNGADIGVTPATFTDDAGIQKNYTLQLQAQGYQEKTVSLRQEPNTGRIVALAIGTFLCLPVGIGFLWGWELPEASYSYKLYPEGAPAAMPYPSQPQPPPQPSQQPSL